MNTKETITDGNTLHPRLVSAKILGKMFNPIVSTKTIISWRRQRIIPFYKIGGRYYFNQDEVLFSLREKHRITY